ncbi:N-substituted formamide deformylase [Durusdinium trenchii]|uniref:N-substituted formamide deformylase n=1 Tax=Durusdinium trenchii TaxID=1381693 RepID=A0ABP0KUE1_9DINO
MNDLLIDNVTVWAGNRPKPAPGWVAVNDGHFSAVGGTDEQPPDARQRVDGQGKTLLPSFVDCHTHVTAGAIASVCRNGWSFQSKDELLKAVETAAREDATGWLIFFHVGWNCPEIPVPPTAQELEEASGGRKVFLVCESLHRGILSESGLQACNVSQHLGSEFVETKRGVMNGLVWEQVFSACMKQVLDEYIATLSRGDLKEILRAEVNRHLACGITDAHDPGVTYDLCPLMVELNEESPLRLSWSEIGASGAVSSAGDGSGLDNFGNGPSSAKVFTDGAHRCAVCVDAAQAMIMTVGAIADAVKERSIYPIRNMLNEDFAIKGGKFHRVGALFEQHELTEKLGKLSDSHERIKIHALGNHAVDMACECIVESGITTKVCIEHATILDESNFEKLAKYNVQVSAQPGFLPVYGPLFAGMRLTGRYRGLPLRSLLDTGVSLILSSDYPCGPLDPLHNMRCAVERQIKGGKLYCENEAIRQEEAVYGYTIAGTKGITGEKKGGIVAGEPADFVVLTGDPFVHSTVVDSTWIGGSSVYQRQA